MFYKKSELAKHRVLKYLNTLDSSQEPCTEFIERQVPFDKIAKALSRYPKKFLLGTLHTLQTDKEIHCDLKGEDSKFVLLVLGRQSYRERKFLRHGLKLQLDLYYDVLKNVSTLTLLTIAIWTFIQNVWLTKRNSQQINELERRVQSVEQRIKTEKK